MMAHAAEREICSFSFTLAMRTRLETPFVIHFSCSLIQATGCTAVTRCTAALTEVLTADGACGSA